MNEYRKIFRKILLYGVALLVLLGAGWIYLANRWSKELEAGAEMTDISTKYIEKMNLVEWPMRIIACLIGLAIVTYLGLFIYTAIKKKNQK